MSSSTDDTLHPTDRWARAVCETAHARNIPVTAHLELVDADQAILAGLEMPLDVALFGAVETPVDQVDEDIRLQVYAVHNSFFSIPCAR